MVNGGKIEKVLWSIAFPGFGQILNKQVTKGLVFILLELIINVKSNLNEVIISSFQGNIEIAIEQTKYSWLMFYPCIYIYAIYDAYKNSGDQKSPYSFLPFVFSAYLGTLGVIYSQTFKVCGILFGPLWLSIICFVLGAGLGWFFLLIAIRLRFGCQT
jgi:hypothetical protein